MTEIACVANLFVFYSEGYVGEDVESVIAKLLQEANYNVERCQQGLKLRRARRTFELLSRT